MGNIDEEVKAKFMNDQHRFVTNVMFTANWIQGIFDEQIKPYGISSQQYNILRILKGADDWKPMSEVKSLMIEKAPNATRLADKLLKKELIERRRSDVDRRVVYVRITKKGVNLIEEVDKVDNVIMHAMKNNLTAEEAKIASEAMDKFRG